MSATTRPSPHPPLSGALGQGRPPTVRAVGNGANVLKLDKKALLRRIADDPLLALKLFEKLSTRLREANRRLAQRAQDDER